MVKKVASLQPNYIPWKGYFDIIHDVDLFIFSTDVKYNKHNWRNRNQIKTHDGLKWLTIPVGRHEQKAICDVSINDTNWQKTHYKTITQNYSKASFFKLFEDFLHYVYIESEWNNLFNLNRYLIETISRDYLRIKTKFADSREYNPPGTKHERVLNLAKAAEADVYVAGPAAKAYIIEQDYKDAGIKIIWKDYSNYPEYTQLHGKFCHNVSILDLLFNTGKDAPFYIWGKRANEGDELI
jgi:hypothetical protein